MKFEELELIDKLGLGLDSDEKFTGDIPDEILKQHLTSVPEFSQDAPVLFAVRSIAQHNTAGLSREAIKHFDTFQSSGILEALVKYFQGTPASLEALEFLAFAKYERKHNVDLPRVDPELDITPWHAQKELSKDATAAGYALQSQTPEWSSGTFIGDKPRGFFSSRPWLLQFFIESEANSSRSFVEKWWPLVIPALLNFLDTGDLNTKLRALELVDSLASHHQARLQSTGLVPIFESSVEPCLSFLPPLVDVAKTKLIHRPALLCLCKLVETYDKKDKLKRNARLNYLAREGCLKAFLHAEEKIELLLYFLESLRLFLDETLRSLTVIHLHGIVQVLNQILTDPFIGFSQPLIDAACEVMETSIQWAWPRIQQYRYTMVLGLAKANALDSKAFQMLQVSVEETERIKRALASHRQGIA